jgi:hypothetical protein
MVSGQPRGQRTPTLHPPRHLEHRHTHNLEHTYDKFGRGCGQARSRRLGAGI